MTTTQPTCGALYRALTEQLFQERDTHPLLRTCPEGQRDFACFALGTMQGQTEKVYSGACHAFMIRPGADWWEWSIEAMGTICHHYGLATYINSMSGEIWGYAKPWVGRHLQGLYTDVGHNTPLWHSIRAHLCGIEDVDPHYHDREGYLIRCEPESGIAPVGELCDTQD